MRKGASPGASEATAAMVEYRQKVTDLDSSEQHRAAPGWRTCSSVS